MEVQGKIKVIGAELQVSPTFKKKELVVVTDEQYPQSIMIEFTQDKADLLNGYSIGQDVKVSINLGGREWVNPAGETKYFNSIKGWRIEKLDTSKQTPEPIPQETSFPVSTDLRKEEPNDLPF